MRRWTVHPRARLCNSSDDAMLALAVLRMGMAIVVALTVCALIACLLCTTNRSASMCVIQRHGCCFEGQRQGILVGGTLCAVEEEEERGARATQSERRAARVVNDVCISLPSAEEEFARWQVVSTHCQVHCCLSTGVERRACERWLRAQDCP